MSYLTQKVAGVEPSVGGAVPQLGVNDLIANTPNDGQVLALNESGEWEATSAGVPPPLTLAYSAYASGSSYAISLYNYSSTLWAYQWYRNATSRYLATGVAEVNGVSPPATVTNSAFPAGVTLPAGTYFVRWIPAFPTGFATVRLYHTATNGSGGVFFGSVGKVYADISNGGKHGSMAAGVFTTTTTRILRLRLITESTALTTWQAFRNHSVVIERLA
jgi:hypothetical protein